MPKSIWWRRYFLPDSICWLLYAVFQHVKNLIGNPEYKIIYTVGYLSIIIPAFYFLRYCLSFFIAPKQWLYGVLVLVLSLPVLAFLAYCMVYFVLPFVNIRLFTRQFSLAPFIQTIIHYYLQVMSLAMIFFLVEARIRIKAEKEQMRQKYLQASINPHFLFNSLNMLIDLAHSGDRLVLADNMQRLSEIMRYAVEYGDNREGLVTVKKRAVSSESTA